MERWNRYLDGESDIPRHEVDIVEIMHAESLYWLSQAEESFEEGAFTMTIEERIEQKLRELFLAYDNTEGYLANYPRDAEEADHRAIIKSQSDVLLEVLDLRLMVFAGFICSIISESCQQGSQTALYLPVQEWYTDRAGTFADLVRTLTCPIFEAVYAGTHEHCMDMRCACRFLSKLMDDEGDESVAQLRVTERGLTIEQARASIYGW